MLTSMQVTDVNQNASNLKLTTNGKPLLHNYLHGLVQFLSKVSWFIAYTFNWNRPYININMRPTFVKGENKLQNNWS